MSEPKRSKEGSLVSRSSSSIRRVSTQQQPGVECQDSSGVKRELSRGKERICVGERLVLEPKRRAKSTWRTVPCRVSARAGGKVPWREAGRVQQLGGTSMIRGSSSTYIHEWGRRSAYQVLHGGTASKLTPIF